MYVTYLLYVKCANSVNLMPLLLYNKIFLREYWISQSMLINQGDIDRQSTIFFF